MIFDLFQFLIKKYVHVLNRNIFRDNRMRLQEAYKAYIKILNVAIAFLYNN